MDKQKLKEVYDVLYPKYSQYCIFGAGYNGIRMKKIFDLMGVDISFFVDNDSSLYGKKICDIGIIAPKNLIRTENGESFCFICAAFQNATSMAEQLKIINFHNYIIIDDKSIDDFNSIFFYGDADIMQWFPKYYDDERYLKILFKERFKYDLNLDKPMTFNEKLQWLKLYDRNDVYTRMVDKAEVKGYVIEKLYHNKKSVTEPNIGEDISLHIIPTIDVYESFDDIDFDLLPDRFVMKCTHDSGSALAVQKESLDTNALKEKYKNNLRLNFWLKFREWPYKNVKPRILIEEYMETTGKETLPVYKFFCFSGKPFLVQTVINDKKEDEVIDYYDLDWNKLNLRQNYPNSDENIKKPVTLDLMVKYAQILSEGHPFIRVDFYEINKKVYFSEFTFFSDAGFAAFHPDEWDRKLGDLIILPQK